MVIQQGFLPVANLTFNGQALPAAAAKPSLEPADRVSVGSAVPGVVAPSPKDWSVFVYMDGRNRLARSSLQALNKMEQVGSTDRVNVVVQSTIEPTAKETRKWGIEHGNTVRYLVTQDDKPTEITSTPVEKLPQSEPLTKESLADFIKWGIEKFPSEKIMLVVKKHGAGFARIGGGAGGRDLAPLSARETKEALEQVRQETGRTIDVVAFDSCSMQQMEVAYQLKDNARVMVASPEDIVASIYPYGNILDGLTRFPQMTDKQLGRWVVEAHKVAVGRTIQTATDLTKLKAFGSAMKSFTNAVVEQKVDRAVLYTHMLNSKSMEAGETDALQFNFRDLGGFLTKVADDDRFPTGVREAAGSARKSMDESLLQHFATEGRQRLKKPTGYSTFLPWKALTPEVRSAYEKLDYVQDTGWLNLIDYTFAGDGPVSKNATKASEAGWLQRMKTLPLKHYKKYISGYLPTACQYTPSCSQYTREAIETHGLLKGGWLGSMRLLSCNGHNSSGHDPVPGRGCTHDHGSCNCSSVANPSHLPAGTADPTFLAQPPAPVEKSALRRTVEKNAVLWAGRLSGITWGACAALAAAPVGLALGAFFGYKAGAGKMDEFTADMLTRHRQATVMGMLKIARPLGMAGDKVNEWASPAGTTAAKVAGATAGSLVGALAGCAGGAVLMAREGNKYGTLWGRNIVKDMFGELPIHPENEAIVQRDYA